MLLHRTTAVSTLTDNPFSSMAPVNTNISLAIATLSHQSKSAHESSKSAMPVSMPSAKLTSLTTCCTNSCSMNRVSSSGVSSRHTSGTTPLSSARTSSDSLYAGSRSVATHLLSFFGDYRTKACCLKTLLKNVPISFAVSTPPVVTSVPLPPVTVARVPTGMSSRIGAAPTVAMPRTMTTS